MAAATMDGFLPVTKQKVAPSSKVADDDTTTSTKSAKPRRCRYGSECRNIDKGCEFYHPKPGDPDDEPYSNLKKKRKAKKKEREKEAAAAEAANTNTNSTSNKPSKKEKKDKSKIQCRYGMECRNTKCPFFHHPAVKDPKSAAKVLLVDSPKAQCTKAPPPPPPPPPPPKAKSTKTSPSNSFANMLMKSEKEKAVSATPSPPTKSSPSALVANHNNNSNKTSPSSVINGGSKNNTPTSPSRKLLATTKKKCRWGSGCRNKKCSFLHPGQVFDPPAVLTPKQLRAEQNNNNSSSLDHHNHEQVEPPKSMSSVLSQMIANVNNQRQQQQSNQPPHPILPPSPRTAREIQQQQAALLNNQQPLPPPGMSMNNNNGGGGYNNDNNTYDQGIIFPYPEESSKVTSPPPPQASPSVQQQQTSESMFNLFTNMWGGSGGDGQNQNNNGVGVHSAPSNNNIPPGYSDNNGYGNNNDRAPLYNLSTSAFQSTSSESAFSRPSAMNNAGMGMSNGHQQQQQQQQQHSMMSGGEQHRHNQHQQQHPPPQNNTDSDFIFELLGISPTSAASGTSSQQQNNQYQQQQQPSSTVMNDIIDDDPFRAQYTHATSGTVQQQQQQVNVNHAAPPEQQRQINEPDISHPAHAARTAELRAQAALVRERVGMNATAGVGSGGNGEAFPAPLVREVYPESARSAYVPGQQHSFHNAPPPTPEVEEFHDCIDSSSRSPSVVTNNSNKKSLLPESNLISEDEMTQSRRAALELRLEAQSGGGTNHEALCALLETCRSKQVIVKLALGKAMEGGQDDGETNLVALLDLNELLVGAITMAESTLRIAEANGKGTKKKTAKPTSSSSNQPPPLKNGGSWETVGTDTTSSTASKTVTKKSNEAKQPPEKKPVNKSKPKSSTVSFKSEPVVKREESPEMLQLPVHVAVDLAKQEKEEKEKMARLLEEARKQAAAAKERKKSKKDKKFDRWLKQNQEERENRTKHWSERIEKENDYIDLIQRLLVAEFLRKSKDKAMGLTNERVLSDPHAAEVIAKECRDAYNVIFGGQKCRVVVAGSENKDMNGRQGALRYWDKEKEKFSVGLDTKKAPESDIQLLPPEILDELSTSRQSKAEKKSTSATSYDVDASDFMSYGGVTLELHFTLHKSHVNALGSSESMKQGLEDFCKSRDEDERRQRLEEEAERKREEEDRKRRAARKAKENAAWERRKEKMKRDKEEYEKMKKEWARERRENGRNIFNDYDDDSEECQCPRCRFGDKFSQKGGNFFFNIGGMPFRVRFDQDDYDSEEDSYEEEFDDRWEEQLREEKLEENRKQAKVLGE